MIDAREQAIYHRMLAGIQVGRKLGHPPELIVAALEGVLETCIRKGESVLDANPAELGEEIGKLYQQRK